MKTNHGIVIAMAGCLMFSQCQKSKSVKDADNSPPQKSDPEDKSRSSVRVSSERTSAQRVPLGRGKEEIKEWLESLPKNDNGLSLNKGFRVLQKHLCETGDYQPLFHMMDLLPEQQSRNLIFWGIGVKSKLGVDHDVTQQVKLANYFGDNKSIIYLRKVYMAVGAKQLDELTKSKLLHSLTPEQFQMVCHGATKEGIKQGFKAANMAPSEAMQRVAAAAVMDVAMRQNSFKASEAVTKVPMGIVHDEAVASMIEYLVKKGNNEEAKPWLDQIQDERARQRAISALK